MNISIFGLGYVGCTNMGCLAKMGHNVIGVDISQYKVDLINDGFPTIIEKDLDNLIRSGFDKKKIGATTDYIKAVKETDISFICVGTPNGEHGHLDLKYVKKVAEDIASGISLKNTFHIVVIRSTVLPGTNDIITQAIANKSQKKAGEDFCVISNPEFLREGNAVQDYFDPGITVIGGSHQKSINTLKKLYEDLPGKIVIVDTPVAETIKLLNNSWHALKVAFANEIGAISKSIGVNTNQLIDVFLSDTRLNISKAYLKPGFAYGGSCLPKDLRALQLISHDNYQNTPVLNSIDRSNRMQVDRAVRFVENIGKRNIGVWGISFKEGTDDLRNSPIVDVIEALLGKGYMISIYDKNVNTTALIGSNKEYISSKLPHLESLIIDSFHSLIEKNDIIIINTTGLQNEYEFISSFPDKHILDLQNIDFLKDKINYVGINW